MDKDFVTHIVSSDEAGYSIGALLKRKFNCSRSLLQQLKTLPNVFVNQIPAKLNARVKAGDILAVNLTWSESAKIIGENIPLEILYEDKDLLIVNKSPGMVVHTTPHHQTGTLANGVVYYLQAKGLYRHFRPVNRLDRDTTGLVVIALNSYGHQQLTLQQANHQLYREYIALVQGQITDNQGTINAPIGRKPGSIIERMVTPEGKVAITHFEVIKRLPKANILKIRLQTGRTHQIRVHLSHLGHPLLGDELYGGDTTLISRQALHAWKVSLNHPVTKERLIIESPLPEDIKTLISRLG